MGLYKLNDNRFLSEEEIAQKRFELLKRNPLTPRQYEIIEGKAENLRMNEVTNLISKCEAQGNPLLAALVYEKYETLITGEREAKYTLGEAKAILQNGTPWRIDWGDTDYPWKVNKER